MFCCPNATNLRYMRIAILARRVYPPGGSERSLLNLRSLFTSHSIRVFGYYQDKNPNDPELDLNRMPDANIPKVPQSILEQINTVQIAEGMKDRLLEYDPDIIFSQHELIYTGAWVAKKRDVPNIVFLRDQGQLANTRYKDCPFGKKLLRTVHDYAIGKSIEWAFKNSDMIVANSTFTAGQYTTRYPNINPKVIYPFIQLSQYKVEPGDSILHVNPQSHKGIGITLDVAKRIDESIIVVGPEPNRKIKDRMEEIENVQYMGYIDDMREVYKKTKLVIYPSRWPEPFGRVPIEAGASGIPTISSGTGGLKESVGIEDFIVDGNKPENYVSKIEWALDNYEECSKLAEQNAKEKAATKQFQKLLSAMSMIDEANLAQ